MAAKKGPIAITEADLIHDTIERLGDKLGADANDGQKTKIVRAVLTALKEEIVASVVQGYSVNLTGLVKFEPVVKAGRKKGTVITNPFKPDEKPKVLKADEPDKFALKIGKSSAVGAQFPTLKTKAGQELHAQLYVKPKAAKKKAA